MHLYSPGSPEMRPVPGRRAPYAFFYENLPGYEPGHFLYFDTSLPLGTVADKMAGLMEQGRFFKQDSTDALTMRVATYNSELEVFGASEVQFTR